MDEILVQRARGGDRDAFERLAVPCEDMIWKCCYRLMQHTQDAQDAMQDAMLKAYLSIGSWRGDASFSTWLYHIAVNACMDALRKRKVRQADSADRLREEGMDLPDPAPSPSVQTEKREERERLRRALDHLDPDQRTALTLYAMEGLSYEEIAGQMRVPGGTVRSRINRARKKLLAELSDLREPDPSSRVQSEKKEDRTL